MASTPPLPPNFNVGFDQRTGVRKDGCFFRRRIHSPHRHLATLIFGGGGAAAGRLFSGWLFISQTPDSRSGGNDIRGCPFQRARFPGGACRRLNSVSRIGHLLGRRLRLLQRHRSRAPLGIVLPRVPLQRSLCPESVIVLAGAFVFFNGIAVVLHLASWHRSSSCALAALSVSRIGHCLGRCLRVLQRHRSRAPLGIVLPRVPYQRSRR